MLTGARQHASFFPESSRWKSSPRSRRSPRGGGTLPRESGTIVSTFLNIFVSTFYLAPDRYCRAPSKASSPIRSLKSIYLSFLDPVEKKEEKRIHKGIFFVAILLNQSFSPSISTLFRRRHLTKRFTPQLENTSSRFLSFSFFSLFSSFLFFNNSNPRWIKGSGQKRKEWL